MSVNLTFLNLYFFLNMQQLLSSFSFPFAYFLNLKAYIYCMVEIILNHLHKKKYTISLFLFILKTIKCSETHFENVLINFNKKKFYDIVNCLLTSTVVFYSFNNFFHIERQITLKCVYIFMHII